MLLRIEHAPVVLEHQGPREYVAASVEHRHALGGRPGPLELPVDSPLGPQRRSLHPGRFHRDGNKALPHLFDHLGIRVNRLTDGTGESGLGGTKTPSLA